MKCTLAQYTFPKVQKILILLAIAFGIGCAAEMKGMNEQGNPLDLYSKLTENFNTILKKLQTDLKTGNDLDSATMVQASIKAIIKASASREKPTSLLHNATNGSSNNIDSLFSGLRPAAYAEDLKLAKKAAENVKLFWTDQPSPAEELKATASCIIDAAIQFSDTLNNPKDNSLIDGKQKARVVILLLNQAKRAYLCAQNLEDKEAKRILNNEFPTLKELSGNITASTGTLPLPLIKLGIGTGLIALISGAAALIVPPLLSRYAGIRPINTALWRIGLSFAPLTVKHPIIKIIGLGGLAWGCVNLYQALKA